MFNAGSENAMSALLASEPEDRSAESVAVLPTLDERVEMYVGSLAAGVVTARMRSLAREHILTAMAADLADHTAKTVLAGDRGRQSVPLLDPRIASTARSVSRIPAPVATQKSDGFFANLKELIASPFTVRRLGMAAVPLVALLVAGSLWNGNWLTGGESPQGASAIGATPGEDGAARTRSIGPQHTDTAAEQNLQDAIVAAEAAHGRSDLAVARKLLDLATLYRAENRFREAH
jgi:hypothetical protein